MNGSCDVLLLALAIRNRQGYKSDMPAPLAVDKEQVRMLVMAVGSEEAARQMGLKSATVRKWAERGGWTEGARERASLVAGSPTPAKTALALTLPETMRPVVVTGVTKPVDALSRTLKERQEHTKLGLSLFTARAARVAARLPKKDLLASAPDVKAVADIAGKVWPEKLEQSIRISMFGAQAKPVEVIDVQAERIE